MGKSVWFRTLAIAMSAVQLSCATLIHGGGTQTVSINTQPPGATVKVGGQDLITPAQIALERNRSYQVVAMKTGYETATTNIDSTFSWVTVLDLVFILPWVIDLVSGSAYALQPELVNLVLTPATPPVPVAATVAIPAARAALAPVAPPAAPQEGNRNF
jgi:hypothetical protein